MKFLRTVKAIVASEKAQGRVVGVLTENRKWFRHLMKAGVMNEPGICWVRSSANVSNLKSIAISTLIVVQNPRPDGLALMSERLRGDPNPRIIKVLDPNVRSL